MDSSTLRPDSHKGYHKVDSVYRFYHFFLYRYALQVSANLCSINRYLQNSSVSSLSPPLPFSLSLPLSLYTFMLTYSRRLEETIEAILDEAFPERCPCSPPIVIYRLSKDDENMYLRTRCRKTKSTVDKILSSREFEEGLNNLDYKEVTKSLKRIIPRDLSKSKRSWNAAYNTVETLKEHKTQYSSSLSADLIGKVKV